MFISGCQLAITTTKCPSWHIGHVQHGSYVQFERTSNNSHHMFNGETQSHVWLSVCVCLCVLVPGCHLMCCHQGFYKLDHFPVSFKNHSDVWPSAPWMPWVPVILQIHSPLDSMTPVCVSWCTIVTAIYLQRIVPQ